MLGCRLVVRESDGRGLATGKKGASAIGPHDSGQRAMRALQAPGLVWMVGLEGDGLQCKGIPLG
jgi:hypothetical protein